MIHVYIRSLEEAMEVRGLDLNENQLIWLPL